MRIVTVVPLGDRLGIKSPLNYEFVRRSKDEFNGEWSKEDGCWVYPKAASGIVLDACRFYFGDDGTHADVCSLLAVLEREDVGKGTDVRFAGRPVLRTTETSFELHEGAEIVQGGVLLEQSLSGRAKRMRIQGFQPATVVRIADMSWTLASNWARSEPHRFLPEDRAPDAIRAGFFHHLRMTKELHEAREQLFTAAKTAFS